MAILEKINDFAKNVGDNASDAIETTKLNSKISAEQNAINAVIVKIGEYYYNKYLETKTADDGIKGFCATIDGHNATIAGAKAEIERLKSKAKPAASAPAQDKADDADSSAKDEKNEKES
jgi:hypothetical protein